MVMQVGVVIADIHYNNIQQTFYAEYCYNYSDKLTTIINCILTFYIIRSKFINFILFKIELNELIKIIDKLLLIMMSTQ